MLLSYFKFFINYCFSLVKQNNKNQLKRLWHVACPCLQTCRNLSFTKDLYDQPSQSNNDTPSTSTAQKNLTFCPIPSTSSHNPHIDFGSLNLSPFYPTQGGCNNSGGGTNVVVSQEGGGADDKLEGAPFLDNLEAIGSRVSLHLDDSNTGKKTTVFVLVSQLGVFAKCECWF